MPKIIADQTIYKAVIQAISEHGYLGASTKQIADMAGVSEVTLFRKYGTKAQLAKQAIAELIGKFGVFTAVQHTGNIRDDLLRIVERYQEMVLEYGHFLGILITEIPRHVELQSAAESPVSFIRAFTGLIVRYQTEGELQIESPMQAISALIGPLLYTGMLNNTVNKLPIQKIDAEEFVDAYLDGRRMED